MPGGAEGLFLAQGPLMAELGESTKLCGGQIRASHQIKFVNPEKIAAIFFSSFY